MFSQGDDDLTKERAAQEHKFRDDICHLAALDIINLDMSHHGSDYTQKHQLFNEINEL